MLATVKQVGIVSRPQTSAGTYTTYELVRWRHIMLLSERSSYSSYSVQIRHMLTLYASMNFVYLLTISFSCNRN